MSPKADYQKPDAGWCGDRRRGAGMGRASDLPHDTTEQLRISNVPLDAGGYDPGGAYWGSGRGTLPLYCVTDGERVAYVRAESFEDARSDFPHATWAPAETVTESDISDMVDGYIECALWSSTDNSDDSGGSPLDENYCPDDVAEETRAEMLSDCASFAQANAQTLLGVVGTGRYDWSQVGHDLWLTRNGHGSGFWDRGLGDAGEALSKAARDLRGVDLYVGDDGKVYG